MQKLYEQCLSNDNIAKAINFILATEHIAGKDGITPNYAKSKIANASIIKEVKLRLRRYKHTDCKLISVYDELYDTKNNLYVYNLYDRMAQQAVVQVLKPILRESMPEYSFGQRRELDKKLAAIKAINILQTSKASYVIKLDFKYCFKSSNISLELLIGSLKAMGIKDYLLLKTIKHLLYSDDIIDFSKQTILAPILINCYLHCVDEWIEQNIDLSNHFSYREFNRHKDHYTEWLEKRNKKPAAKYYRFNNEAIIIGHNRSEQCLILQSLNEWTKANHLSEMKTELSVNSFKFVGFYVKKNFLEKAYLEIRMADPRTVLNRIKRFSFNTAKETLIFRRWFMDILSYYDITNDFSDILNAIDSRIFYRSKRVSNLCKINNCYEYKVGNDSIVLDIGDMRRYSKLSYKEYMFKHNWINIRERLKDWKFYQIQSIWLLYKYILYTRQQGKDPLTKEYLDINNMHIHHIVSRKNSGKNNLKNLILVNKDTHKIIHSDNNKFAKKIKSLQKQYNSTS